MPPHYRPHFCGHPSPPGTPKLIPPSHGFREKHLPVWSHMLWCLIEYYNLPTELIRCLPLLYRDTKDAPLVGGGTLYRYAQLKGVHQGWSLSPLLFLLYFNAFFFNASFLPPLD